MEKLYLISWCDDNHTPSYWLNEKFLGVDMITIAESLLNLKLDNFILKEINITGDSFPEDIWEQLFDYFQTTPTFDNVDIKLIIEDKWQNFYEKNIKKIRRKVLTK